MKDFKKVILALVLALVFIMPPATMLQNDAPDDQQPIDDASMLTNEQEVETPSEDEVTLPTVKEDEEFDVNAEGERSSKKFLDAFKLNFDPFDPEDGEMEKVARKIRKLLKE